MLTGFSKEGVLTKRGKKPGMTSVVIAGMHGNEPCGIEAFRELLPGFSIEYGTVHFIVGNPAALKKNVRFTEFNLNRAFLPASAYSAKTKRTYEYRRAQAIKRYLDKAGASLDVHSTRNKGKPFIICEANGTGLIQQFPRSCAIAVHSFGKYEPGATDDYMDRNGKIGICVECGQHADPSATNVALGAIRAFLEARGHVLPGRPPRNPKRTVLAIRKMHITKTDFKLARTFKDFTFLEKGDPIGRDGTRSVRAPFDGYLLFAHDCSGKGEEAFLFARRRG